jgi:hypothetical protein
VNTLSRYSPNTNLSPEEFQQFLAKLAETPVDLRTFLTEVAAVNSELAGLYRSFQTADFLNSECGASYTQAGFILNLTEVASRLVPIFSAVARFVPEIQLATPVMLGLSALGSGSALIRQAQIQNTLDMTNPATRKALLINVCEYTKVARRLRVIQSVDNGTLEDVQQLTRSLATAQAQQLEDHFQPSQIRRSQELDQQIEILNSLRQQTSWGQQEVTSLLHRISEPISGFNTCRTLLGRWKATGLPVFQRAQTLLETSFAPTGQRPWASIDLVSLREIWLMDFAAARSKVLVLPLDRNPKTQAFCQQDLSQLLSLTAEVFTSIASALTQRQREIFQEISEQPELQRITTIRRSFQSEIKTLGEIETIFRSLTQNGHSIARSEIEIEFNYARLGLFGARDSSFCVLGHCLGYGGYSPAMAWLDFYWGHFQRNRDAFKQTYQSLVKQAYRLTRSGRYDFIQRDAQGNALKDSRGRDLEMSLHQKQAQIAQDWQIAQRLESLKPEAITPGAPFHAQVCSELQRAWSHWASLVDQLAAQILFCEEITPWVHPGLDNRLARHCFDQRRPDQTIVRSSTVRSTRESLVTRGLFARAQLIRHTAQALRCLP